jgi:hypothetical protein
MGARRYDSPRLLGRAELDAALTSDDVQALRHIVVAVTTTGDTTTAVELVRRLLEHGDEKVRGNAVLGVGHLARRFGTVPADLVLGVRAAALDPSAYVRGQADAAADDLATFTRTDPA